jgi:hypothetical protein
MAGPFIKVSILFLKQALKAVKYLTPHQDQEEDDEYEDVDEDVDVDVQ